MTAPFAPFAADFLHLTGEIVWCTATTVDAKGRPRSRILHPIWQVRDDQPVGWVVTGQTPIKTRHLAANPHLACSYWSPAQHTVMIDCVASWIEDAATKRHVFDLFMTTPPPLGYDLSVSGPPDRERHSFRSASPLARANHPLRRLVRRPHPKNMAR
ncbi:MAG: pyridoxamine 5'-phosphate oxidase family protein [Thermomicrobiales bacterium]